MNESKWQRVKANDNEWSFWLKFFLRVMLWYEYFKNEKVILIQRKLIQTVVADVLKVCLFTRRQ